MAVENWIDAIARRWEISDGKGGTVRSFRVYEKAEFPEAITIFPCALTYTTDVTPIYGASAIDREMWNGVTEFHLFEGVNKSNFPELMRYFNRIITAAAGDVTLGGLVSYFMIRQEGGPGISGPVVLQYGSESPHHGIVVNWVVKERQAILVA